MAAPNTLSVPPELMSQIEAAAQAMNQTPDEWAIEAMHRQLEESRWQKMLKRNEAYAQAVNIAEADVPNLLHQDRLQRKR